VNKKIGILAGMEWDHFPMALIQRINQVQGFQAELAKIDATPENFTKKYDVLVDRISHEVPFYRFHLKAAMLAGTYVINDPLWFSADDKFFGFSLATRIGVTVPRTVMLPQREYIPAIDPNRSLNNLVYPLDWEGIARYVGFPAICKPADGGGWRNVNRVNNMDELMNVYNNSGQLVLTMQQFIEFDDYVRCLVIGREHVRMIRYNVKTRSYLPDKNFLPAALEARITDSARELNRALGYDMNSVEFAIKDGVPYAIDFTNPAPDMYPHHILPDNYEWCLEKMSELCITAAREGRQNDVNHSWQRYLEKKTSHPAAPAAAPRATTVTAVATAR
jgi:glutathione synthase/RimK-type ligase-like ATP-grasp enzyme